ncbi:MAG: efflux transporter periplasmic adaptor subunit [Robiginitomaculum sp.]|nr:MAG: efflux transporter periplasmic adaptor subunit [Robiginitomaculum sp.]
MGNETIGIQRQSGGIGRKILVIAVPILILLLFVLLGGGLQNLTKKPDIKKRSRPMLAVTASIAVSDTVQLKVNVQGESRPRTEIDLVPEVAGKIVYVSPKFISGGIFSKGDVLYRIDPADYNVAVVRAKAAVARAKQILVREQSEGAIARLDWDDLGAGKQATDLTLRKPQLLEAEAGLQSAQADEDNANIRLRRTAVTAPFNGRVREKVADIGQYVNPGSRLGRIFSTDIAEVRLALSDADIARIDLPMAFVTESRDNALDVKLSAIIGGKIRVWDGKIMRTDAVYDPQTRSMFAIAEVVDPYGTGAADGGYPMSPGLFVDAEIEGKILEGVIVIPRDALRPENKVYTVNQDGIATIHDVDVLDTNPERAALLGGVEPGALVIVSPLEQSQINYKFRVLDVNDPTIILVDVKKEENKKDKNKPEGQSSLAAAKKKLAESKKSYATAKKEYAIAKKKSRKKKNKKERNKEKREKQTSEQKEQDDKSKEGAE